MLQELLGHAVAVIRNRCKKLSMIRLFTGKLRNFEADFSAILRIFNGIGKEI